MEKEVKKQLLIIDPKHEITFKGPYNQLLTEYFTLKNPTEWTIAFKVKTTAPKRYSVRPNNGQLVPNQTVKVMVMLQPFNLTPREKHKHKFMIQSVVVPDNTQANANVDLLFKCASPDEIMDSKFKCVFMNESNNEMTIPPIEPMLVSSLATNTAQNYEKHLLDDDAVSGDDLVSNAANSGMGEYFSNSLAAGATTETNNNHNIFDNEDEDYNNGISSKTAAGATTSRNKKFNLNIKQNDFGTSSNSSYENTNVQTNSQYTFKDKNDVENKLKMAEKEIQMLKDKLQQVQRYARKYASSTPEVNNSGILPNNQQLIQLSAMVVFISFIIGIFFGKAFF